MSNDTTHASSSGGSRQTPQRQIRIPDDVYYPAVAKAKDQGTTVANVITEALERYLAGG